MADPKRPAQDEEYNGLAPDELDEVDVNNGLAPDEMEEPPEDMVAPPSEPAPVATQHQPTPTPAPAPARLYDTAVNLGIATNLLPFGAPSEAALRGALASFTQGPTMSWADEAAGLLSARDAGLRNMVQGKASPDAATLEDLVRSYMAQSTSAEEARDMARERLYGFGGSKYIQGRNGFRDAEGAFREDHPVDAFGLNVLGGAALGSPVSVEGSAAYNVLPHAAWAAAPRVARAARYIPALAEGALSGAGAAEESSDMGRAAAVGAPFGVAGQAMGEGLGAAAGAIGQWIGQSRLFTGLIQPSKAAEYLRSKHVGGLTVGQMAPDSYLAQMEEASMSAAGVGPAIKAQRDVARQQWQQAVLREALPPGQDAAVGDDIGEQMASVFGGFDSVYNSVKGHPIDPRAPLAALKAVDDPTIYASDGTRRQVAKFVKDQITALKPRPDGAFDSGEVLALRSFLRQELRNLPDDARQDRALLQGTVDLLSDALDTELPPDVAATLRAADRQYVKAKTVGDAVGRARDQQDGFTTKQMSTAIAQNTPTAIYQQGGGGELRRLAQAGESALAPKIPITGARLLSAGPVPYLTGPMAYAMNLPGPKSALLGRTALQQSVVQGTAGLQDALTGPTGRLGVATANAQRNRAESSPVPVPDGPDWISTVATTQPEILGKWGQYLNTAAMQGQEALGQAHNRLAETDSEYQALMRRLGGQDQ